jgi:hypothetical protein
MKTYIGCKIIKASPMKSPEGDEDGYKVIYPDGYISWSPKDVFEGAYREISDQEKNLIHEKPATITNTSEDEVHTEWLMGGNPEAIKDQEARGQDELCNGSQLPCESSHENLLAIFSKHGIAVKAEQKDPLFYDVVLPAGWEIVPTENNNLWSELKNDKGDTVALIFYKAAFYDRKAQIDFIEESGKKNK